MADISKEIQAFRNAIYGEEVRGSMISLAEKVNQESTNAKTASAQSAQSAAASVQLANVAVGRADTAAENANDAAQDIQERADRGEFTSTVQVGSVTTGEAGTEASVNNSGTSKDAILDFTIPRGDKGVSMRMAGVWSAGTEYVNNASRIDIVSCNGSTYGCRQSHTAAADNAPAGEENAYWICLAKKGDTGNIENIDTIPIAFAEAAEQENLESGDSLPTGFGKIKRWFSDILDGAGSTLLGKNLEEGKVLVSDAAGKVSVSNVTRVQLENRPNAFQSSLTIPVTSGWLKIAKLSKSAMLRSDIPDSETLAVSFSCTPTTDTGDYDQACRFVITETWAGSKIRVLSSFHTKTAVVTQVRKVYDETEEMFYLELEVNVPSCPCTMNLSIESGIIPWEPIESIQFDTGGGVNEIYQYTVTEDRFAYIDTELGRKQNNLAIPVNSIEDLDTHFEGLMWYNREQVTGGSVPFDYYGFLLSFKTSNNVMQLAIPFSNMENENLKYRSYANGRWYDWMSVSDRNEKFSPTANAAYTGRIAASYCTFNAATRQVHIFISVLDITGAAGGAVIATIPQKYRPSAAVSGFAIVRGDSFGVAPGYGTLRPDGGIVQNITSNTFSQFHFVADYFI